MDITKFDQNIDILPSSRMRTEGRMSTKRKVSSAESATLGAGKKCGFCKSIGHNKQSCPTALSIGKLMTKGIYELICSVPNTEIALDMRTLIRLFLEIQWRYNEIRSGSMSENLVISINNFSVDFAISIPPGNCCIWNSRGNASQIDGVLIPRPLLAHWLLLKGWREFNLDC